MTSMKIGTSMWGFREWDVESVLTFCADAGIGSVEAQVHPGTPRHFHIGLGDDEIDRIVKRAAEMGITFDALSVANDFTTAAERIPLEIERVLAGLDLAKRIGALRVRIFAGWRAPADVDAAAYDRMIEALRRVSRHARELGIRLALENHGGLTATTEDVRRILDAVGETSLGLLYDPVNFVRSGQDPVEVLHVLRDSIVYTHAKDLTPSGGVCAVGQGVLPWTSILRELPKNPSTLVVIEQTDPVDVRETTRQSLAAIKAGAERTSEALA